MLDAIAIMPSAPVLVPELAGAAAAELGQLRAAVCTAAAALPRRWVAVGAASAADGDASFGPDSVGTFAGFGVDLPVRLSPDARRSVPLPLCALMAGWVRGRARPDAAVCAHVCADPDTGAAWGRRLRAEIDAVPEPIGVLVVADGANTLSATAPGGHRPGDLAVQHALDDALAAGDSAALLDLPAQLRGRAGFAVLAGLLGGAAARSARELYRGAPYGVGYFAGVWRP